MIWFFKIVEIQSAEIFWKQTAYSDSKNTWEMDSREILAENINAEIFLKY